MVSLLYHQITTTNKKKKSMQMQAYSLPVKSATAKKQHVAMTHP